MPPSRTFDDEPVRIVEPVVPKSAKAASESVTEVEVEAEAEAEATTASRRGNIIDIRRRSVEHSIRDDLMAQLRPADGGEKRMPTLLLYDEAGLKLFEDITYLDEYYLTNAEIEVLRRDADRIAERMRPGSMLVELGSGNLRKTNILLAALDRRGLELDYFALDLSLSELDRTLAQVPPTYRHVRCHGLHGTYDDGLAWLQRPANRPRPKCILSLGSSIGNFPRDAAVGFLRDFAAVLQPSDTLLIGLDGCQDGDKVFHAYNDRDGVTHDFLRNGLVHANRLLGKTAFEPADWEVVGEYDSAAGRHHAFYSPRRDLVLDGIRFSAGERVRVEESYKYSAQQSKTLWSRAGLVEGARWGNDGSFYFIHMLSRPAYSFALDPAVYAAGPVPAYPQEWESLWAVWDMVTREMIQKSDLSSKPIELRNACIFYLGHIPCFLDLHLARATDGVATAPADYQRIFERGIDPDVDNPERCHAHSEIPDAWPEVDDILAYQARVRDRLRAQYLSGAVQSQVRLARALWIAFEHEAMHLETLLYMLLQSHRTLPPPVGVRPDFEAMARQAATEAVANRWITVPQRTVSLGLADPDRDGGPDRYFGWDNEKPRRDAVVPAFVVQARPISNGEYASYLEHHPTKAVPASWSDRLATSDDDALAEDGDLSQVVPRGKADHDVGEVVPPPSPGFLRGRSVRTVYGLVPLSLALDWPVMASYDELAAYAKWRDGRIPTLEETRSIYGYAEELKTTESNEILTARFAAVNGHLSNDGVEETPPSGVVREQGSLSPTELFANLEGCNVGFQHWHPLPVTQNGNRLSGQADNGGVWEWTSSVLERHDGFAPMSLYPAYTADFFDGKHNVVLGGSWATHPRIAGRKTFVNWYQRNYPYAWAGARLARDL